jgi:uncharacterized protein (TIGR02118 family)
MTDTADQTVVYVTYRGTSETRFDREYYVERHLPLVMRSWSQYGLQEIAAFFPPVQQGGTIALCECRFRDDEAVRAAFASPEVPAVMADVERFSDVRPTRSRATAL